MTYRFFDDEAKALTYLTIQRARGLRGYMLHYRAGTIEVRVWR